MNFFLLSLHPYPDPATPETHQVQSHLGPLLGLFPVPGTLPQIFTGQLAHFLHVFAQISPPQMWPTLTVLFSIAAPIPSLCSGCSIPFYLSLSSVLHNQIYYAYCLIIEELECGLPKDRELLLCITID